MLRGLNTSMDYERFVMKLRDGLTGTTYLI